MLCFSISFGGERRAVLLLGLRARAERDVAHVLDARADDDVVDAGRDERRAEVHGPPGRAALAVDGRGGRLDRQALLQPGVARDVERLLTELLDAARDDVLDLGGVDAGSLEDLGVGLAEEIVRVRALVVALLRDVRARSGVRTASTMTTSRPCWPARILSKAG